jgi:mono/diheme cytochrome c family protein
MKTSPTPGNGLAGSFRTTFRFPAWTIPCWVFHLTLLGRAFAADLPADQVEFFESRIRPILAQECYECHNSRGDEKGGLNLDHRSAWQKGGNTGPVIVPGDPGASLLLKSIRHEEADLEMPKAGAKLDDRIIADFTKWIELGAPDPRDEPPSAEQLASDTDWEAIRTRRQGWWSFQPIVNPAIPNATGVTHPVDRFIRAKLATEGLKPAPAADPRTLLRRLHFTLAGLPPTLAETQSFLAAWERDRTAAVENRIDGLLAAPTFGERWARHWMDWTRYADSHGSEGDPAIPYAWRYRDYLIRALNADIPYDQLVREHLAGDLLESPRINESLALNESAIGLGHLRMVYHGFAPTDVLDERVRFTDDQIDTVSKAFLGLTVSCARCHNHKFDAISQADYYAMFGIFTSSLPATVTVDAPGVLEKNREALIEEKARIKQAVADHWIANLASVPTAWNPLLEKPSDEKGIVSFLQKIRALSEDRPAIARLWTETSDALKKEQSATEALKASDTVKIWWDFSDPAEAKRWTGFGLGLSPARSSPAGEFTLALDGARLFDRILPAGSYTHGISSRDAGLLASEPLLLDDEYDLYVDVAGDGSSFRYAVQHYPRSGTVFPVKNLEGGAWKQEKFDRLDYWKGDSIHLEFATAPDAPILAKDAERSWFGVRDAILVKKGSPAPTHAAQEYLAPLFDRGDALVPQTLDEALARYAQTLRETILHWRTNDGTFSDEEALFLQSSIEGGLLLNSLEGLPADLLAAHQQYTSLESQIPVATRAPGLHEQKGIDQALYVQGSHKQPGEIIPRRFLEAIDRTPYATTGSGRLEFAGDLLRSDNPFTARVIVNRLWSYLFEKGLVTTVDNFGRLGESPSHPELLDHLAFRFREEQGWSIKTLIRDLLLTETWQQDGLVTDDSESLDPENRWLSHYPMHRLDAEAIRDSFLAVSGQLDPQLFGPPVEGTSNRRSLYVRVNRNTLDPLLTTFDFPTPVSAVGRRDATNVPAQSLTLLNDPFIIEQAGLWVKKTSGENPEAMIRQLYETALTRSPSESELEQARAFVESIEVERGADQRRFSELSTEQNRREADLAAILEPIRRTLLSELRSPTPSGVSPADAFEPLSMWTFDQDLHDGRGQLHGTSVGSTGIVEGALRVTGDGFVASAPLDQDLAEKTIAAVVQLDALDQRGGGVMTVQDLQGGIFDSIVIGERREKHWLSGSDNFTRTLDFEGMEESEAVGTPIHLAFTYESDGTIRAYRNGEPYGKSIRKAPLHTFKAGQAQVLFGLRHGKAPSGNRTLRGQILEARLFDRALTPAEARALTSGNGQFVSEREILNALNPTHKTEKVRLETEIKEIRLEMEILRRRGAGEADPSKAWRDLAHAIFNFKEFLYLR